MKTTLSIIFILLLTSSTVFASKKPIVRYFQIGERYAYRIELLKTVLEFTKDEYGDVELKPYSEEVITQRRGEHLLASGTVDIAFFPRSNERDKKFSIINRPIMEGILGYRILIIKEENLKSFKNVKNKEEFVLNFLAGFGSHWSDLELLKNNGIKVVSSPKYQNLFKMLHAKRFDYFPRGLDEAYKEVREWKHKYSDLVVEPSIALYYDNPVYFFTNNKNQKLKERIAKGLELLMKTKRFKEMFLKYHREDIKLAKMKSRRVFYLSKKSKEKVWWLK